MSGAKGARRVLLIGFGAIGLEFVSALERRDALERLAGVLVKPGRAAAARGGLPPGVAIVESVEQALALAPDLVIEAAGQPAVAGHALPFLAAGVDLMLASTGALADPIIAAAARKGLGSGAALLIPSGAVAGVDGLLGARTADLREVRYTSIKRPESWRGTPGEALALNEPPQRTVLFEGSAREAAARFPKNANVSATIALAGIGFDRTKVALVSDPAVEGPVGLIEASGGFGSMRAEMLALASPLNPKTSAITAHNLAAAALEGMAFAPPAERL